MSNYRLFKSDIKLITKDLLESISDLAITTNASFQITNFNTNANAFFNRKNTEITSFLSDYVIDEKQNLQLLIENLSINNAVEEEIHLIDKTNIHRILNLKAAAFKDGESVIGYTFLFSDLTQIRAQEKSLKELNSTKDRLFAIIGHDLRKPALEFRGIQSKVNYLVKKNDFSMLEKLGVSLEKSALSLNNMLYNLLNWAHQQRGVVSYNPETIIVNHTIYDLTEFFEDLTQSKNICIVNTISNDTSIQADSSAFKVIIRNLLDNAIKFTPEKGVITLSETLTPETVTIEVNDTGVGMDEAKLNSIFDLTNTKRTKGTQGEIGSGIGLSLVKEFVAINKGDITVQSSLNNGTSFYVTFPR